MNKKQQIIEGLKTCSEKQQKLFLRIYSFNNLNADINDVVLALTEKETNVAYGLVMRTLESNKLPKEEPTPVVTEKPAIDLEKEKIKSDAINAADESFFETKDESPRKVVGGSDTIEFNSGDKKYFVRWDGFWEKSDWYDYLITGDGVEIRGTRFL